MNPTVKKIIAVAAGVFILLIGYYGNYLPLRKSQMYIEVLRMSDSIKTLPDFEGGFATSLDAASPIGQEELVRNTGTVVLSLLQRTGGNGDVAKELVRYTEHYFQPIIERGRGMSFNQNLYILGAINQFAFSDTRDVKYLRTAKAYFEQGLQLSPKRPQFLYGLFDVNRISGDVEAVKQVAGVILEQWPNDTKARAALDSYLKRVQTLSPKNS